MSVFNFTKKSDFIAIAKNLNFDSEAAYQSAQQMVEYRKKKTPIPDGNHIIRLERKWYRSILTEPDYMVYSDPYYLCDLWSCWILYSRESVKTLTRPKSAISKSVVDHFGKVQTVLDVGCGIGLTTAFNGDSIGHFNEYSHLGKRLSDKQMSRFFNKAMRGWGYKRVETKIWNNRPMVWERRGLGRR